MEKPWGLVGILLAVAVVELCNGLPMELLSRNDGPNAQLIGVLVAVMVSVCVIVAFVGCVCCQRRQGFKVFRDSPVTASVINETNLTGDDPGHVNPIASAEFTIFTPLSPPHHNNNVFRSHQPVISYIQNENQPAVSDKLVSPEIDGVDVSCWFDGSQSDFPRSKLKYIRELGTGWFGRVVEGEAQGIPDNQQNGWTPVAVRILESSASAHEQTLFLHEANMYRNNESLHPNILQLLGRSLEATPLLLIQEFCPKGDLKKFLLENQSCSNSPVMTELPLKFCCQLASALQYLHEKNVPHLDLAARTCQISSDLTLRLGDYGLGVNQYPNDYYQGTPAIPVRWCAPETLNFTSTTLQPKQVTCEGNIWSLGVAMWEISEWGKQPYDWLTDDEVVSQVLGTPHVRLQQPQLIAYYIQPLYRLMQLCWQPQDSRPQINQIYSMLLHLLQSHQQNNASRSPSRSPDFPMEDFDSRWDTFKPNTIVKTDNHIEATTLSVPTDKITDVSSVSSVSEIFVNPDKHKSPSMTNLHGSIENLAAEDEAELPVQHMDSWLQNVASHTSDMQYVRGLSQAIQALDSALASEQTSSSGSSFEPGPAPELSAEQHTQQKIEFRLGINLPLNRDLSMDESNNTMDSIFFARRSDSGSETEDETWKRRIERGAYSEKVRQKSKSVADLMILTHIDCSDTDSETPLQSLEYRVNYKNVRCAPKSNLETSTLMFGSEGNLLAVQDTFQKELKKLQEERRDSLLFVPACHSSDRDISKASSADRSITECDTVVKLHEPFVNKSDKLSVASEFKLQEELGVTEEIKDTEELKVEEDIETKSQQEVTTVLEFSENNQNISRICDTEKTEMDVQKIETYTEPEVNVSNIDSIEKIKIASNNKFISDQNINFIREEISNLISEATDAVRNKIQDETEEKISNISEITDTVRIKIQDKTKEEISNILSEVANETTSDIFESHILPTTSFKINEVQTNIITDIDTENRVEFLPNDNKTIVELPNLEVESICDKKETELLKLEIKPKEIVKSTTEEENLSVETNLNDKTIITDINISFESSEDKILPLQEPNLLNFQQETTAEPLIIEEDEIVENIENTSELIVTKDLTEPISNQISLAVFKKPLITTEIQLPISENVNETVLEPIFLTQFELATENKDNNKFEIDLTTSDVLELTTNKTENVVVLKVDEQLPAVEDKENSQKTLDTSDIDLTKEMLISADILESSSVKKELVQNVVPIDSEQLSVNINNTNENNQNITATSNIELLQPTSVQEELVQTEVEPLVKEIEQLPNNEENTDKYEEQRNYIVTDLLEPSLVQKELEKNVVESLVFIENETANKDKASEDMVNKEINIDKSNTDLSKELLISSDSLEPTLVQEESFENVGELLVLEENEQIPVSEDKEFNINLSQELQSDLILIEPIIEQSNSEIIANNNNQESKESLLVNIAEEIMKPDETKTQIEHQESSLDNSNKNKNELNIANIFTCKKEEYPLIQNFINNERTALITESEQNKNASKEDTSNVNNKHLPETVATNPSIPADIFDLTDTSNTQQINQIFNVYSVTIDQKPPLDVFDSPMKSFYARPYNETELITDINDLLLESEQKTIESKSPEKLIAQLGLVCSTNLPNEHLLNVLNTPPIINGINCELTNKIIDTYEHDQIDFNKKKLVSNSSLLEKFENIATVNDNEKEIVKMQHYQSKLNHENDIKNKDSETNKNLFEDKIQNKNIQENLLKLSETILINSKNNNSNIEEIQNEIKIPEDTTFNKSEFAISTKELPVICVTENHHKDYESSDIKSDITYLKNAESVTNGDIQQNINLCETFLINETYSLPKKLSELASDILTQNSSSTNETNEDQTEETNSEENISTVQEIMDDFPSSSTSVKSGFQNETYSKESVRSPRKLTDIVLDSLKNIPEIQNETYIHDNTFDFMDNLNESEPDKNQNCTHTIEREIRENQNSLDINTTNIITSTPFGKHITPKLSETADGAKSSKFFSFVSEGDEPSDPQTTVILGPCEDYTLGLYSGLKTTFGKYSDDDRPEEEVLQFSSNFMPFTEDSTSGNQYFSNNIKDFITTNNSVDYSLETWDRFLGKSLQDQDNGPTSIFDHFSPKHESIDDFSDKIKTEITEDETHLPNKTFELKNANLKNTVTISNDNTFTLDSGNKNNLVLNETYDCQNNEEKSTEEDNKTFILDARPQHNETEDNDSDTAVLNSWEPGEGWFLHPQDAPEDLTGQIDISGSDNTDENSYVRFTLDEECVNALRNELAAKLPHAQCSAHEEQLEPEEWDSEERNEIIVKYNVYATPLSPIPEESFCDDVYCDQNQHRESSDSESDWSEPCLGRTSQLEDILIVDTETHTALILESPSLREPQHRHTPSQDSCCSNDTLFNLEDLNYGLIDNENSPQHQGHLKNEADHEMLLEIEITESETPKQSPSHLQIEDADDTPRILQSDLNVESDSTDINVTYTKPDINVDEKLEEIKPNTLELNLNPASFAIAPLPSPEDIPWRQLPASLLTYNEMIHQNDKFDIQDSEIPKGDTTNDANEDLTRLVIQDAVKLDQDDLSDSVRECTLDTDLYSNLTDIRFSGPCDAQLMSTSFSESADYADERDWDSGSDTRSSSSGEFIWKGVIDDINPMDAIEEEENSNTSEDSEDDCDEDIEETEFVPSAWDAQATPTKSALRSPEKSNNRKNQQKGVWFKKQKYHCVYEYPREPESPVAPPTSDLWRPLSDFSNYTDWELDAESCLATLEDSSSLDCREGGYDSVLDKFISRSSYPLASGSARHRDLYQLQPFPEFGAGLSGSGSDEDFFISSSARPFQAIGQSSQFFPGQTSSKAKFQWQDYQSSSSQSSRDLSDNITPDSGVEDVTPASLSDNTNLTPILQLSAPRNKVQTLKCLAAIAANKNNASNDGKSQDSLGGLRHTRNRLKLDLPTSPNSFTSTRTFSIDLTNDPVVNREVPTFTTFGKTRFSVQHVQTPTDDSDSSLGKAKLKNVCFEALPHKPLQLNASNTVYIVDKSEDSDKQRPVVEMVQGEASLLDSADEDSGIESSANATLERHQQQIFN